MSSQCYDLIVNFPQIQWSFVLSTDSANLNGGISLLYKVCLSLFIFFPCAEIVIQPNALQSPGLRFTSLWFSGIFSTINLDSEFPAQ